MEDMSWALGVASNNVHAAHEPPRGVLGILASMMEHSCTPSCILEVGPTKRGSMLTLKTLRPIEEDEPLSISYVSLTLPFEERRRALRFQYGFECARCEAAEAEQGVVV